jgi:hypothetical protein
VSRSALRARESRVVTVLTGAPITTEISTALRLSQ